MAVVGEFVEGQGERFFDYPTLKKARISRAKILGTYLNLQVTYDMN